MGVMWSRVVLEKKWFGGDAVGGGEIGYDAAKKYQEIVGALDGGSRKRTQPCRGNMYVYMYERVQDGANRGILT